MSGTYFKSRLLELKQKEEGSGREQCPHGRGRCRCGICATCGKPLHDAVHGPALRRPAQQWHHAFVASKVRRGAGSDVRTEVFAFGES